MSSSSICAIFRFFSNQADLKETNTLNAFIRTLSFVRSYFISEVDLTRVQVDLARVQVDLAKMQVYLAREMDLARVQMDLARIQVNLARIQVA